MTYPLVPWPLWVAFAVAVAVALHLATRNLDARRPIVPFVAGLLVGIIITGAATPRPAQEPAPIRDRTGIEQGSSLPAAPGRAAAPLPPGLPSLPRIGTGPASAGDAPDPIPSGAPIRGRASWYPASGRIAAAGPALRRALGPGWRGSVVMVSAGGRSVVVRLTDWCQCYRGTDRERLVDLGSEAFAELAPLSAGLVRVRIVPILPPATDTR